MNTISAFADQAPNFLIGLASFVGLTVLPFLVLMGTIVFMHELGHVVGLGGRRSGAGVRLPVRGGVVAGPDGDDQGDNDHQGSDAPPSCVRHPHRPASSSRCSSSGPRTNFAAASGSVGPSPYDGQSLASTHTPHAGFLA